MRKMRVELISGILSLAIILSSLPSFAGSRGGTGSKQDSDAATLYSLFYPSSSARCKVEVRTGFFEGYSNIHFLIDGNEVFTTGRFYAEGANSSALVISNILQEGSVHGYSGEREILVTQDQLLSLYRTYHCDDGQSLAPHPGPFIQESQAKILQDSAQGSGHDENRVQSLAK